MEHLYGEFSDEQVDHLVQRYHKLIHRLLIYKDSHIEMNNRETFDFERHFLTLLKNMGGFNSLLGNPPKIGMALCSLQSAFNECQSEFFDYQIYRKFLLDAHSELDDAVKER